MQLFKIILMIGLGLSPASALSPLSVPTTGRSTSNTDINKDNNVKTSHCDVLVLGAGAAGIAAARELHKQGLHTIVLEARNRVGGRAHTSDELNVGLALDHGAKWLHGASPQNRMVQLLELQESTESLQKVPSFVPLSDCSSDSSSSSSETLDDVAEMDPSKCATRLLRLDPVTQQITASEPRPLAKSVAQELFAQVMKVFDHPTSVLGNDEPDASLLELLSRKSNNNHHPRSFWKNNPVFQTALQTLATKEEQEAFQNQVEALLNLEFNLFFDNWEGAPIDQVSARFGLEGTMLEGGNALWAGGYGGRIEELAEPIQGIIRLNHEIQSITTTQEGGVVCQAQVANRLEQFQAPVCIVALPLGVLKSKQIRFEPPLPLSIQTSIDKLGVAIMNKVELSFPHAWWQPGMERFTLACSHLNQGPSYHPWTSFIVEAASGDQNVMVCYLHGDFAQDTEQKSNDEIQKECMQVLRNANLTSEDIPDPLAIHVTRWYQDPHSRGCWTYYAKDSGSKDARQFREDEECHQRGLYFAGEHTCDGSIPGLDLGCVHGAWLSGELAAAAAIQQIEAAGVLSGVVA